MKKKVLSIVLILFLSLFSMVNVKAAFDGKVTKISEIEKIKNNLRVEHISADHVDIQVTGTNNYNIYPNLTEDCGKASSCNYFLHSKTVLDAKGVTTVVIPYSDRANATIKIIYDKVGKYDGKEVGAIFTISDIPASTEGLPTNAPVEIQISDSLYEGINYFSIHGHKQTYEFFYSDDASKKIIDLKNAYVTIGSNNYFSNVDPVEHPQKCYGKTSCNESIYFTSSQLSNLEQVIVTDESNMVETSNLKNKYAFGIGPNSNNFIDVLGSSNYTNNAVTFKFNNKASFYVDSSIGGRRQYVWMSISTAPVGTVLPNEPTKYINKSNKRVNTSEYKVGDEVNFEVDQKVNVLGVDALLRYSSFQMTDSLPKEVDYVSAEIYKGSTKITDGTFNYSDTNHKLTWTASSNFLKTMSLNGETYTLKIKCKTNSKFKGGVKNKAISIINGENLVSNEVFLEKVPTDPKKEVNLKYINDITTVEYRVSQEIPGLSTVDGKTNYYNSFYLKDILGKTQSTDNSDAFDTSRTEVKVIDLKDGSDKSSYFDININGSEIIATAKKSILNSDKFYGTTYEMIIKAKIKEDYFEAKGEGALTVINNVGTRFIDPGSEPSWAKEKNTNDVQSTVINPNNPIKEVNTEMIREEKEFKYTITSEVQPATEDNYYKSYIFKDDIEAPLQIIADKVKITQIDNGTKKEKDYTDKFNIQVVGNTITCTLKNPKDSDFYGTREQGTDKEILKKYKFEVPVSLRKNAENILDMSKYIDDIRYKIPNVGNIISENDQGESRTKTTNEVQVYYYPEKEPEKSVSEENITDLFLQKKEFKYSIKQTVLAYDENNYYDSFEFRDKFENVLDINKNIVIKNEAGIAVTSWFDVSVNDNVVTAILKKENNNSNFYGHTYTFEVNAKVKENADLQPYKAGSQYIIPNEASFIYDGKVEKKTNKREVYINLDNLVVNVPKTNKNTVLTIIGISILLIGSIIFYIVKKKMRIELNPKSWTVYK